MTTPTTKADDGGRIFTCNAIIEDAWVGFSRDFMLDAWVHLKYDGCGQGFGGFVLGGVPDAKCGQHWDQPNLAAEFLVSVLRVADVDRWDRLKGKTVRVRKTDEFGDIIAIGHIVKDLWFDPRAAFKALAARKAGAQ